MPVNRSPLAYGAELGELWLRGISAPNGVATPWGAKASAIGLRQRLYAFRNAARKLAGPNNPPIEIEAGAIKLECKRFPPLDDQRWRLVILRPDVNLSNLVLIDPVTGDYICAPTQPTPSSALSSSSPSSDLSDSSQSSFDDHPEPQNPAPDRA